MKVIVNLYCPLEPYFHGAAVALVPRPPSTRDSIERMRERRNSEANKGCILNIKLLKQSYETGITRHG